MDAYMDLPVTVPGSTVNRLCASGAEAVVQAGRALAVGDARFVVAGGVEGMSRAPCVVPKPDEALPTSMEMHQTTVGWRMVNARFPRHWTDSLGACAERVAAELGIGRDQQDAWALRSHQLADEAWDKRLHDENAMAVQDVTRDESIRPGTSADKLAATPLGQLLGSAGHPLGASALRVVVDLCRELRRRGGGIGVAAACIGVGQGSAVVCKVEE